MIVMITVMTGIPEAISKEREMGTFDGMLSAPINQISIILGYTASLCVKGFAQVILVLAIAIIFFGVTIQGSILLAFFLLLLGIFSFVGIGILAVKESSHGYYNRKFDNVPYDVSCRYILSHTTDAMVYARHF